MELKRLPQVDPLDTVWFRLVGKDADEVIPESFIVKVYGELVDEGKIIDDPNVWTDDEFERGMSLQMILERWRERRWEGT